MPTSLRISTLHFKPYPTLSQSLLNNSQRGRVVIITGGARGIGLSITHAFVAGASSVHLLGRTASTLSRTKSDLEERYKGCEVHTHTTDIADESSVNDAFESIKRTSTKEKDLTGYVLVHAAAFLPVPDDLVQTSQDASQVGGGEWWKTFDINVHGTYLIFQAFADLTCAIPPNCVTDDDEALIINLVSASAYAFTAPGISAYSASKLAAIRMAECMACEGLTKSNRARVINLHPGAVVTEMWKKSGGESVGIPCNDEELVPQFVLWLTMPAARFLHGRTVEANWDIDELLEQKELIVAEDLLTTSLRGYPFNSAESWGAVVQESLVEEATRHEKR